MGKTILLGFLAGFLAVLVFHQGTVFLLHHWGNAVPAVVRVLGRTAGPGFSMAGVPPFGVPRVISLAFWGGIWGILLAGLVHRRPWSDLLIGFLFGAVAATLVGFTLVARLRGVPMCAGGNLQTWLRVGLLNGAWGWGTALLLRPLLRLR